MAMNKDNYIYRTKIATPLGENYFSKVVDEDDKYGGYSGGMLLDPKNKEHKEFIELLTELENSCREEAGDESVKVSTAIRNGTRDGKKIQYIKATSKFQPTTQSKISGESPLKYDPWGGDIIRMAIQPVYNMGRTNPNHRGLKLYVSAMTLEEEGETRKNGSGAGVSGAELLGIELPDSVEAGDTEIDSGDDIEMLL